jgi:hypothetical protein
LLVVDEFLRMNGKDDSIVEYGKDNLIRVVGRFNQLFGLNAKPLFCSSFMRSREYVHTFQQTSEQIDATGLTERVLDTVPESKRHLTSARDYPVHELTCVKFLSEQGYTLKIGPQKEKQYDQIMALLGFDVSFEYLLDAYALGTRTADTVVHYVPTSRGPNNGQRIFLEDDERKVKIKLQQGCDEALRYFCKIASVSGHLLGLDFRGEDEINSMFGKKLKRETVRLVLDNIVIPYNEVL